MPDPIANATTWTPQSAWPGLPPSGRLGRAGGKAGVTVEPREGLHLVSVVATETNGSALSERIEARFGARLPMTPRVVQGAEIGFIWSGRNHWLAIASDRQATERLRAELAGLAAVSEQSASRAILRLAGPRVRNVLAKGCTIDLHPRAFRTGDVALTSIAHIGVQLWQTDDQPTFEVAVSRSYAGGFWSWLSASVAEFGCDLAPSPPARG